MACFKLGKELFFEGHYLLSRRLILAAQTSRPISQGAMFACPRLSMLRPDVRAQSHFLSQSWAV